MTDIQPNITAKDFIDQFTEPAVYSSDGPYNSEPANEYKFDDPNGLYPRFDKLVNQLPQYLKANPTVLAALMYYTGYTKAQIMQMVAPGQGPTIVLEENSEYILGHYDETDRYNVPVNPKPDVFYINAAYVRGLEAANLRSTQEATAFLLAVVIFHETVHLGRNMNNLPDGHKEYGQKFEELAFKVKVTPDNATNLLNYQFVLN